MADGKGRPRETESVQAISMAERLRRWRESQGRSRVPEADLLRDMLYIMQGINGKHIKFVDATRQRVPDIVFNDEAEPAVVPYVRIVEEEGFISNSTQDQLFRLAELGFLFRQIEEGLQTRLADGNRGLIEQSLARAIQIELTAYFRLVAVLESRLGPPRPPETTDVVDELPPLDDSTGLSLIRLFVYTGDAKLRLRLASVFVEGCSTAHGGALVSLIHSYTSHGDPFVRTFTDALLEEISKPFFRILASWIYEGVLQDPFHEFFVELNDEARSRRIPDSVVDGDGDGQEDGGAPSTLVHNSWTRKFSFRKDMLPSFIGETFGRKIFQTGKSLNFLASSCGDASWVVEHSRGDGGKPLEYRDVPGLERSIDSAYTVASQRLFEVFFGKFRLLDHLRALKDYILLSKGDFVEILIEELGTSLTKLANSLYRHTITANLESAIRGSSSEKDDEGVLRRLDARMTNFAQGELGWDAFTLEYHVDSPLDTILDPDSMNQYLRLFKQLWQMKRVELALNSAWSRLVPGAQTYAKVDTMRADFHRVRIVLASMSHFIRALQYFCHVEVVQRDWQELEEVCRKKQGDLDSLIEKHAEYLQRITQRVMLYTPKAGKEEVLLTLVRKIFRLVLQYRDSVDALCNCAFEEITRLEVQRDARRDIRSGSTSPAFGSSSMKLDKVRERLESAAAEFESSVVSLYSALSSHPIVDLRFLAAHINFNWHIHALRAKSKEGWGGGGGPST